MTFGKLWSWIIGKSIDDTYLLTLEQSKVARLQETYNTAKEKAEVLRQLLTARKEAKELEEALGKRSRLRVYIIGLVALLMVIFTVKDCI